MIEFNKITLGDAINLLPKINDRSCDLIFTDPPYLHSLADLYKSWNFKNHDWVYFAEQFDRILKHSGQVVMFTDVPTLVAISNAFQKFFRFRFYWIWIKSNGQIVNKMQPISNVELISVWAKKKTLTRDLTFNPIMERGLSYRKKHKSGNLTRKKEKGYVTVNENGDRFPKQTLYYPSKDNLPESERTTHPTQKPIGLIGYVVKTLSNKNSLILDPFCGSGTLGNACHRLSRNFICIEKNPEYFREAKKRLINEISQEVLFK